MQTWAKRGVQAALVTGGMIAAGTSVASAGDSCPNRPAPPLGESALSPANSLYRQHGTRCFSGELFPDKPSENRAPKHSTHPITALAGTLPLQDFRDAPTLPFIPAIPPDFGLADLPTEPRIELVPPPAHALDDTVPLPAIDQRSAEVPHRNSTWHGSVPDTPAEAARTASTPDTDGGIVELWQNALGRAPVLQAPEELDLVTPDLSGPKPTVYSIPNELVDMLKTAWSVPTPKPSPPSSERTGVPTWVPGDHQLKVDEVPILFGALTQPRPEPTQSDADPSSSRIMDALSGNTGLFGKETLSQPRFARDPLAMPVRVTEVDALLADGQYGLIAKNPFPFGFDSASAPRLSVLGHAVVEEPTVPFVFDLNAVETTMPLRAIPAFA